MTLTHDHPPTRQSAWAEFQAYVSLACVLVIMLVLMFWPAGTIDWRRGWLFFTVYLILIGVSISWIKRDNPELIAVRQKYQKGGKAWDRVVAALVIVLYIAIFPVAGFDDVRFGWAPTPDWVTLIGHAMLIAGFMGVTWAQARNRHFETMVRIQTDRDHKVIDGGPYAHIRHPGYAFAVLMCAGMALALGSLFALIPVGLLAILLAGRTLGEEDALKRGLPGYRDYMTRVKWRWAPLIW